METKDFSFEIKTVEESDDNIIIGGYGSVFGNKDAYDDIVDTGAFTKTLKDLPMLWQHRHSEPVGLWNEVREDDNGLYLKGILPKDDSFVSGRVAPQLRIGSVRGLSIGFETVDYSTEIEDGVRVRHLKEIDLWEVSLVTFPANAEANVLHVKSVARLKSLPIGELKNALKNGTLTKQCVEELMTLIRGGGLPKDAGAAEEIIAKMSSLL